MTARKKIVKLVVKGKRKAKKKKNTASTVAGKPVFGGKYNLLVTFNPNNHAGAKKELQDVLGKIGETPKIAPTQSDGIFKVKVSDPRRVISRLAGLCRADPNLFLSTFHYTPIDSWSKSTIQQMQRSVRKAAGGISEGETWKISVNKRLWSKLSGTELTIKLAEAVNKGNVSLEKPAKIVQVEIIGKEAGISLLKQGNLLNISNLKET